MLEVGALTVGSFTGAVGDPFTVVFLLLAIAMGANREPYWSALVMVPFGYWASGLWGAILMLVGYAVARLVSGAWSRRAG